MPTTPVPRLVKTLAHEKNLKDAKTTLCNITKKKTISTPWKVLLMLALGGAGWIVARRYMKAAHLSGIGPATVAALKKLGQTLKITPTPFDVNRIRALDALKKSLSSHVRDGTLTGKVGLQKLQKAFKKSDPKEIQKAYLVDFATHVIARESFFNPIKHALAYGATHATRRATSMYK